MEEKNMDEDRENIEESQNNSGQSKESAEEIEEIKKSIDESWKETVEKERGSLKEKEASKEAGAKETEEKFVPPEANFGFFITTLSLQASIALGQVPNPVTNKKEEELPQAKFLIDTLGMLKEKTKGNLNKDEENLLEGLLYELRLQYVTKAKGEAK